MSCHLLKKVLSFTRNLAHRVRESFSGISSGLQRAGDVHSVLSEDESSPGHSRSTQPQNMYSFNVVLLDPAVDIIPRRKFRDALRQDGRIVELSLPRGAQGPEAQKKTDQCLSPLHSQSQVGGIFIYMYGVKYSKYNIFPSCSFNLFPNSLCPPSPFFNVCRSGVFLG